MVKKVGKLTEIVGSKHVGHLSVGPEQVLIDDPVPGGWRLVARSDQDVALRGRRSVQIYKLHNSTVLVDVPFLSTPIKIKDLSKIEHNIYGF